MSTKKEIGDRQGRILFAVIGTFVAIILTAVWLQSSKPTPDAENCIGKVTRSTVILLDHSERISTQTQDEIIARVNNHIANSVKLNERVSVFALSEDSKNRLAPLMTACMPENQGNGFTDNKRLVLKDFQEKFELPLRAAISSPIQGSTQSPIAQAIADLSASRYLKSEVNTLIVFSDMIENSNRLTMYGCTSPDSIIQTYRENTKGSIERPEFQSTTIKINMIPRTDLGRTVHQCKDKFWPWFFGNHTGSTKGVSIEYLPG
jgi:hypothetical protein